MHARRTGHTWLLFRSFGSADEGLRELVRGSAEAGLTRPSSRRVSSSLRPADAGSASAALCVCGVIAPHLLVIPLSGPSPLHARPEFHLTQYIRHVNGECRHGSAPAQECSWLTAPSDKPGVACKTAQSLVTATVTVRKILSHLVYAALRCRTVAMTSVRRNRRTQLNRELWRQ